LAVANLLIDSAINPDGAPIPHLLKLKGDTLMDLGQLAEAGAALDMALEGARERQTLPIQWQVHRSRERLAQQLGRAEEAARERQAAAAIVDQLASTLDEPERGAFRQRAPH